METSIAVARTGRSGVAEGGEEQWQAARCGGRQRVRVRLGAVEGVATDRPVNAHPRLGVAFLGSSMYTDTHVLFVVSCGSPPV